MIDVEKQITYWRDGSVEDWQVALELINLRRTRHGLFFAHLALEKMLKAHICRATADLAPRMHTLLRLAEGTGLAYSEEQRIFLARFDRYQIEGRYPDLLPPPPSQDVARAELKLAGELFQWLKRQL